MTDPSGDYGNDLRLGAFVDRDTFQFVRDYDHPPELVWTALTDAKQLGVWLWPCTRFDPAPDGRFVFNIEDKVWEGADRRIQAANVASVRRNALRTGARRWRMPADGEPWQTARWMEPHGAGRAPRLVRKT